MQFYLLKPFKSFPLIFLWQFQYQLASNFGASASYKECNANQDIKYFKSRFYLILLDTIKIIIEFQFEVEVLI